MFVDFSARYRTATIFLSVILITAGFLATGNCLYETNDDMLMISLLTGAQGVKASPDAVFLGLPLGIILYKLYALSGSIPFYGVLMYSCLVTGCTLGVRTIFSSSATLMQKFVAASAVFGLYIHLILQLNFAAVSLYLWFAVISALAVKNLNREPFRITDALFGCLLGLSYLIRPDILLLAIFFSLPAVVTFLNEPAKKRLVAIVVPLLAIILLTNGCLYLYHNDPEYRNFTQFNSARSRYGDTNLFKQNAQTVTALAKTGWSWADHFMTRFLWFHDGNIYSAEKLSTFSEQNKKNQTSLLSLQDSVGTLNYHRSYLLIFFLALIPLIFRKQEQQGGRQTHFILMICALATTVTGFLLLTAFRFPMRVSIPLFSYLILCAVLYRPYIAFVAPKKRYVTAWLSGICILGTLLLAGREIRADYRSAALLKRIKKHSDSAILKVCEMNGPGTILVSASGSSFFVEAADPLGEYRDMVRFTGLPMGWMIGSPVYSEFLCANGFIDRKNVVAKMIDNPRVVLAFWDSELLPFNLYEGQFLNHLQSNYAALFPGRELFLNKVFDNRNVLGNFGWVFFTLNSSPSVGAKL